MFLRGEWEFKIISYAPGQSKFDMILLWYLPELENWKL